MSTSDFRVLHTMLRVQDMERSIDFYTRLLGMRLLFRKDHLKNQFTQAYVGYGEEPEHMAIELVFNWNQEEPYEQGSAFGHVAIGVSDIFRLCDGLTAENVPMPRPPKSQKHHENVIAFIEDPDGYKIELVEQKSAEA
ncbi:MAG TPA: lactoylglutathione lyase [Patescibacteria group bacterium]|nr:lactoylglutathione lyase [Patescibacteria group bacterium]